LKKIYCILEAIILYIFTQQLIYNTLHFFHAFFHFKKKKKPPTFFLEFHSFPNILPPITNLGKFSTKEKTKIMFGGGRRSHNIEGFKQLSNSITLL
jgi:hypothetical protein